VNSSHAFACTT